MYSLTIRPYLVLDKQHESMGSPDSVILSDRRENKYCFPISLSEYGDHKVVLILESDNKSLRISTVNDTESGSVRKRGDAKFRYERRLKKQARQGFAKNQLKVVIGGSKYLLSVLIPLEGDALDQRRFELMLEDMSHWLHTSLHRRTELEIKPKTKDISDSGLRAEIAAFYRIRDNVTKLEDIVAHISRSPAQRVQNTYRRTHKHTPRQDAQTIRWKESRSGILGSLTYESNQTFDTYENQFVLFLIHQLKRLLITTSRSASKTEDKLLYSLNKTKRLSKQGYRSDYQLRDAKRDYERCKDIIDDISKLQRRLRKLENYPFLRDVSYDASQFQVSLPLSFTQDVNYARALSIYQKIRQSPQLRQLSKAGQFTEGVSSLGVQRTSKIYEYWTFFAVHKTLIELGFIEDSKSNIFNMIDQETLTPGLTPGKSVNLYYQHKNKADSHRPLHLPDLSGVTIKLYYEKEFWNGRPRSGNPAARPDVTMEIYQNGRYLVGRFMLDAKYCTKSKPGSNKWEDAKRQVGEKYQSKEVGGVIDKGMGAFFLHLDTNERDFDDSNCSEARKRWQGHLPLLPGKTDDLKVLLKRDLVGQRIPQFLSYG